MECNKDEALRAREIAEKKIMEKDFVGGKKFALKAQNLFPELDGISQLLATLDVYISSEKLINGVVDWYGILGVDPTADEDTIRKNYRRLALILHPDKNKSVGADGAFKFLSEAWSLLSDAIKRKDYDKKHNFQGIYSKVPNSDLIPPPTKNGVTHNKRHTPSSASSPCIIKPNTFWTYCKRCQMQYEYPRKYLGHMLLCPNCRDPFHAVEVPAPNGSTTRWSSQQEQFLPNKDKNVPAGAPPNKRVSPSYARVPSNMPQRPGVFSKPVNVQNTQASVSLPAQNAHVSEKTYKNRNEARADALKEEAIRKRVYASMKTGAVLAGGPSLEVLASANKSDTQIKRRRVDVKAMANHFSEGLSQNDNSDVERVNLSGSKRPNSTSDLWPVETRNRLMKRARLEIQQKLNEWRMASAITSSKNLELLDEKKAENEKNPRKIDGNCDVNDANISKESVQIDKVSDDAKEEIKTMSMTVPDPDFHDFDKDRTEKAFDNNQVWAAYDNDDGMPRFYAMIHTVLSTSPLKMKISWLNSKNNTEIAPLNWVGSGFPKTCGELYRGKHEVYKTLNCFSHKVKFTKGPRGSIQIYPKKGDVWALYRNWSPDWNELTPDDVIHKYDMVEVLEDYDEEQGVTVAPLVKVAGFKTVFHQHMNLGTFITIKKEELFRFSHQVPSYSLTGQEAPNAPKGCRELDPAATPLELLIVEEMVKVAESGKEDDLSTANVETDGL